MDLRLNSQASLMELTQCITVDYRVKQQRVALRCYHGYMLSEWPVTCRLRLPAKAQAIGKNAEAFICSVFNVT